jgi:hypothetical protein
MMGRVSAGPVSVGLCVAVLANVVVEALEALETQSPEVVHLADVAGDADVATHIGVDGRRHFAGRKKGYRREQLIGR